MDNRVTFAGVGMFESSVICDSSVVSGMSDGEICVVGDSAHDRDFVDELERVRNLWADIYDERLYEYNVQVVARNGILSDGLREVIDSGVNMIVPLSTPNSEGRHCLAVRMLRGELAEFLPALIAEAERLSRSAIEDALMNLAVQESKTCRRLLARLRQGADDDDFAISVMSGAFADDDYDMALAPADDCMMSPSLSDVSYKESRRIFSRFVRNCKLVKRAERMGGDITQALEQKVMKAKRELDFVFGTIWGANKNMEDFKRFFLTQSDPKLKNSFDNYLNREKMAEQSNVSILIEHSADGIDPGRRNDGYYRVYADNGRQRVQVHFSRKPSCVVYMMYLLDRRRRGDDVDTLRIAKNKVLFCDIYRMVYGGSGVGSVFNGLTAKITAGKPRQTRLKDCYLDIQHSLREAVGMLGETALPFIIPNENSHLTIRADKISVPAPFDDAKFEY